MIGARRPALPWRRREPLSGSRRRRPSAAAASALVVALLAGCGGVAAQSGRADPGPASTPATRPSGPAPTSTTTPPTTTTSTDPGGLPQTPEEPPVGAALGARLQPLWHALVSGASAPALPLFFPESAYLQMKTGQLAYPASDYTGRLLSFYRLDLAAYHAALGNVITRLQEVDANPADAAWIPPGSCENGIGYWHLPGVRLVYRTPAGVESFAVASLISWRGVWYVVHLGPNPRPTDAGTVDQPAAGPGVPGPAGGC